MSSRPFTVIFAALGASLMMTSAQAAVVNFEDVTVGVGGLFLNNGGVVSQGFNAVHAGDFAVVYGNQGQGATDFSGNGSNRWISFNASTLTFSEVGGADFSLLAFDGGESWVNQPHSWATQIRAIGFYSVGGTTTQTFDLDLIKSPLNGMQTFSFNSSFTGLNSVRFSGIGGNPEFSVDNIVVGSAAAVPVPATLALVLAGLGLLGASMRRQGRGA